jgi:hypothetical protein
LREIPSSFRHVWSWISQVWLAPSTSRRLQNLRHRTLQRG